MEKTAEEYLRLVCEKLDIPWVIQGDECVADLISNRIFTEVENKRKYYGFTLIMEDCSIREVEPYIFKINEKFIKCDVVYDSWLAESEFLGCYFVEPREKTVFEYVKIGE